MFKHLDFHVSLLFTFHLSLSYTYGHIHASLAHDNVAVPLITAPGSKNREKQSTSKDDRVGTELDVSLDDVEKRDSTSFDKTSSQAPRLFRRRCCSPLSNHQED